MRRAILRRIGHLYASASHVVALACVVSQSGCTQLETPRAGQLPQQQQELSETATAPQAATPDVTATAQTINRNRGGAETATPRDAEMLGHTCRILAIGDSLTDPKSGGGGYLKALESQCGCVVENLGRGGAMVNQMRKQLALHLANTPSKYDYILIFGGVNDLYSDETAHRTVTKIERDLEAMYRAGRDSGARMIALTVAPWGGFQRYFTAKRAETTQELNAWILSRRGLTPDDITVDAYAALSCGKPERLCERFAPPFKDGLHFGREGHAKLGAAILEALGPLGCKETPVNGSIPPKIPARIE